MKLTDEQSKMVENNHNLIYGYIHKRGLSVEEWYGILAIELCKTVMNFNPDRGTMSTYFYMRCDSKVKNSYRKSKTKKRSHNGIVNLEDYEFEQSETSNHFIDGAKEEHLLEQLLEDNPKNREIIILTYQGYTQQEVAEITGISQAQISRRLQKVDRGVLEYDK